MNKPTADLTIGRLHGVISNDTSTHGNHPFPDGVPVSTSTIDSAYFVDGVLHIETLNTVYKTNITEKSIE